MLLKELAKSFTFLPEEIEFYNQNELCPHYEVKLPESYIAFLNYFGAGTLGNFFQFYPPAQMNTHRERLEPFIDDELNEILDENDSGDILIFATTDNGDMLGWKLEEMKLNREPRVFEIPTRTFEVREIGNDVGDLIRSLVENPPSHLLNMELIHLKRCL